MRIPVYQQINDILREEIRQGKYKAGNTIPSVNQLAKDFSTSRNTSVKAISNLVNEGIVYTVQGKGTIVSDYVTDIKIQDVWMFVFIGQKYNTTITGMAYPVKSSSPNPPAQTMTQKLDELKALHDKGTLTDAEYNTARKK